MKSFQIFNQSINCILKTYINTIGKEKYRTQVFNEVEVVKVPKEKL